MADWQIESTSSSENTTVLKIKKVGNKRKADNSIEISKKPKMDLEEVKQMISDAVSKTSDAYKVILEENNKKIIAGLDSKLEPLTIEVASLSNKHDTLHDTVSSQGRDMSDLRSTVDSLKSTLKSEIVNEIGDTSSHLSAYKHTLSVENEKVASNLLIFGLKAENPSEKVKELFSQLSIPSDLAYTIMSVSKMGKDGGERVPTLLVTFQNGFQRNEILKYAKNLPKGVVFDRDIPLGYREQYKIMKRKAYKHRKFFNCSTQIIFVGHLMQLRYRDRDNSATKSYTIIDEFFPHPNSMANHVKGNSSKAGAAPSVSVNDASLKNAKRTLLLSNIGDATTLTIDAGLKQLLNKSEFDNVQKIDIQHGSAHILCSSPTQCKLIAKNYNGKTANGLKFSFETFDF